MFGSPSFEKIPWGFDAKLRDSQLSTPQVPDVVRDQRCRPARYREFDQMIVPFIGQIGAPEEKDRRPTAYAEKRVEQFIPFARRQRGGVKYTFSRKHFFVFSKKLLTDQRLTTLP